MSVLKAFLGTSAFCVLLLFTTSATAGEDSKNTHVAGESAEKAQVALSEKRKKALVHMVKQDCGSCHGMTLKGGLGPALLPENLKNKPLLFINNTIFYGRPGTAMPPWKNILTEQETLWISQQLQQGIINEQ